MTIIDECYTDLAIAVVLQAVDDWRQAQTDLQELGHDNKRASKNLRSCEKFFNSKWFKTIVGFDGRRLLIRLKEQQHGYQNGT